MTDTTSLLPGPAADWREVLAARPTPLACFVRDDDAGWDDTSLLELLDVTQSEGVPMDLAAIPAAVSPSLARELATRHDAAPHQVRMHQHGYAHHNHEAAGRRCEFGPAREASALRADLEQGRARLREQFGDRVDPFFTPPWNRCAPGVPALLRELGFAALSRDRGALAQQVLPEMPVDVDWSRHYREGGRAALGEAIAAGLAARGRDGRPFGLMLHHAVMDAEERRLLARWLRELAAQPGLRFEPMATLLPQRNHR